MSFKISPPLPTLASKESDRIPLQLNSTGNEIEEEWVEIIEPKSKTKIYANLESGVCAKNAPEGVTVLKADDFDDHWWELFDNKTGKYYYYNPEQQKTVWAKPTNSSSPINGSNNETSSRRKLLIIPVSKLQTLKRLSPVTDRNYHSQITKCDAATQTIASNLVTTGTQTFSENELCEKLNEVDLRNENRQQSQKQTSPRSYNLQPRISSKIAEYQNAFKLQQASTDNHRQTTETFGRKRGPLHGSINQKTIIENSNGNSKSQSLDQSEQLNHQRYPNKSSHISSLNKELYSSFYSVHSKHDKESNNDGNVLDYFGPKPPPPPSTSSQKNSQHQRRSVHLRDNTLASSFRPDTSPQNSVNLTTASSFKSSPSPTTSIAANNRIVTDPSQHSSRVECGPDQSVTSKDQSGQPVVTNNLSHYLVREARAMGIALISDDELDDDDQDSDDELVNDDDEDTDLRDDSSSTKDIGNDLHASQDLGGESSEAGWRSFSDRESPNAQPGSGFVKKPQISAISCGRRRYKQPPHPSESKVPRSPIFCEITASSFRYDNNELIDDQKDPASCRSQQLDHKKLVENFKKSRQTSALGFNDSLSRSYRLDTNNAVQRLKTVADTYFNNTGNTSPSANMLQDKDPPGSDRYLRHLSTLSTLPRSIKAKPPQIPQDIDLEADADYDVVEENCSYYSDSERNQASFEQSVAQQGSKQVNSKGTNDSNNDNSLPMINYFDRNKSTRGSTFSVESFARENLSRHPKKGGLLFNRKVKWSRMISWTKNSIKQPMISSVGADLTSESIASFKLVQQFMGDRKITMSKRYRQVLMQSGLTDHEISSMTHRKSLGRQGSLSASNTLNNSSSNVGATSTTATGQATNNMPDRLRDELAFELAVKGCVNVALRDEIFVQLARQLTDNPSGDSTTWGLVLMSILLNYFSPSTKFAPFLLSFLETHAHQMAQDVCLPRLEKRLRQNWPSYCRKPADGKEISIVRLSITKWPQYCGVFGESLERIMSIQTCSPYLKTLRLPWILTTLGDKLMETGGAETEGIFRCAADHDLLAQLRLEIDCVDFRKITDANQLKSLLTNVDDPHIIAGLLKLFFRQLSKPVFPCRIYDACLSDCNDAANACRLFNERLPNLNKDVVAYLIRLLQILSEHDKVVNTKMDTANLSMVWAPNLLRAPESANCTTMGYCANDSRSGSKWSISNSSALGSGGGGDEQQQYQGSTTAQPSLSQSMIFEQTRQEMQFIKLLITNLDTSFIENVL